MGDQQRLRSNAQSDQNLFQAFEYSMSVKLLTEHNLEYLSLKGGCTGSSESTLIKMPYYWKFHVTAHIQCYPIRYTYQLPPINCIVACCLINDVRLMACVFIRS